RHHGTRRPDLLWRSEDGGEQGAGTDLNQRCGGGLMGKGEAEKKKSRDQQKRQRDLAAAKRSPTVERLRKTRVITCWEDLATLVTWYRSGVWLFRGESSPDVELLPKAGRRRGSRDRESVMTPEILNDPGAERRALDEFKRLALPHCD